MRKALVAGNWKMNGRAAQNSELITSVLEGLERQALASRIDVMVFPPSLYVNQVQTLAQGSALAVGGQNLCEYGDGAYTGEISAGMLADCGCSAVLVGHSERRALFGDTRERVAAKTAAALEQGITPVLCLGETLDERDSGAALETVAGQFESAVAGLDVAQVERLVLAYEPVWAIGTGRTATPEQAQEIHACLRGLLAKKSATAAEKVRILYGGSVNAINASELFAQTDIDGGLVGGASLKANDFLAICQAAASS